MISVSDEALRPGGWNVHLYPSPLTHESRIDRLCASVDQFGLFDVVCQVGVWQMGLADRENWGGPVRKLRVHRPTAWRESTIGKMIAAVAWTSRVYRVLGPHRVTCVNCHSLSTLLLGVLLKFRHRAKLVYDAHELETETTMMRGLRRPVLKLFERLLIRFADEVIVVSDSISDWYRRAYGIREPVVVRNVPGYVVAEDIERPNVFRDHFAIPEDALIFLYQGVIAPGRHIAEFLDVFEKGSDDRHLVVMGFGKLEPVVRAAAVRSARVHFLPAVGPEDVLRHTMSADVGLCGVENLCLSYYFSLPNKLFEFLAAGVPPIVPDFPEMRRIVAEHECGWIVRDDGWAGVIGAIDHASAGRYRARARCCLAVLVGT